MISSEQTVETRTSATMHVDGFGELPVFDEQVDTIRPWWILRGDPWCARYGQAYRPVAHR